MTDKVKSSEKGLRNDFGCARIKMEGAPIHPDDVECDLTDEQYQRQLEAYNRFHKIPAG